MNDGSCFYGGYDTNAIITWQEDPVGWLSRCNCMVVTAVGVSYDEAIAALEAHRAETES